MQRIEKLASANASTKTKVQSLLAAVKAKMCGAPKEIDFPRVNARETVAA